MRSVSRAVLVCISLLAMGCGPMVIFAGGKLSGEVKTPPRDWSFSETIEVIQLETRPDAPYSVNLWGAAKDGTFYVMAASHDQRWVKNLEADPNVRLKICDDVYELKAAEVTDEATIEGVIEVLVAKYDFTPNAEQRAEGALFSLTPR